MLVFSLLCLLSAVVALPAPQSSELASPEDGLFTNELEAGQDNEFEEKNNEGLGELLLQPIPQPPQLEPVIAPVIFEIEGAELEKEYSGEEKGEKENEKELSEENKEEDKNPEGQKPIVVTLEVSRPSFLANLFSNFPISWPPSLPFSLPEFNFPSFPFFGSSQQPQALYRSYYPEIPDYRHVYVK